MTRFSEKPPGDNALINGGFFVLHPDVLDRIAGDDTPWETAPLESLARDGELRAYRHTGFWQPMDTTARQDDAGDAVVVGRGAVEDVERLSYRFRVIGERLAVRAFWRDDRDDTDCCSASWRAYRRRAVAAGAQNPQPAPPQEAIRPVAPPNASQSAAGADRPGRPRGRARGQPTLSDKLSRQQGTLQPPSVDPGYPGAHTALAGHHAGDSAARHAGRRSEGRAEVIRPPQRLAHPCNLRRRSVPDTSAD